MRDVRVLPKRQSPIYPFNIHDTRVKTLELKEKNRNSLSKDLYLENKTQGDLLGIGYVNVFSVCDKGSYTIQHKLAVRRL